MQDGEKINAILHRAPVRTHYRARIGDVVDIELPRIPMTRYTQHVRLAVDAPAGDALVVGGAESFAGEGVLDPSHVRGVAVGPGTAHVTVRAVDSVSGEAIPGVQPIDITVEVAPPDGE